MKFVILGSGRVGSRMAVSLDEMGHQVSIIDRNRDAFNRLPSTFKGLTVIGVGIDEDVMRRAGIEKADVFAAVTNGDNTNIMACEVAKEIFHVPQVIARIYDPLRGETYDALGLQTVCPTTLISEYILDKVISGTKSIPEPALPAGTNPARFVSGADK